VSESAQPPRPGRAGRRPKVASRAAIGRQESPLSHQQSCEISDSRAVFSAVFGSGRHRATTFWPASPSITGEAWLIAARRCGGRCRSTVGVRRLGWAGGPSAMEWGAPSSPPSPVSHRAPPAAALRESVWIALG